MATRWGIISAGRISSDFVAALRVLPTSEHRVVAVAARSIDDAKKFAQTFGIEKAYGDYMDIAKDPDVDVVYIGSIPTQHLKIGTAMMKAGKPILCEKPLCMNVKETKEMIRVAKEQKVFMMDAVWSRFFPVYKELGRRIESGEIGEVVHVIANFGLDVRSILRLQNSKTGGGVTLEIGIYPIQFTSLIMGGEKPLKVIAGGHLNSGGVDECIGATLLYPNGKIASITASMKSDLPSEAFVIGTKGRIKVFYPMWCPEQFESPSGTFTERLPNTGHQFNFLNSQGLMYEAVEVRRCLKEGLLESPGMPHSESVTIAEIMEAVRTQAGTVYPGDE